MVYETNDDFAIASRIADGYPFVGFVNYYLCKPLIALQHIFPKVNCFEILLIAASFYAFVCILKTIFDTSNNFFVRVVSVCTTAIFSLDHYCMLQFTKTAALLMVAGMLLMMDAVTKKRKVSVYGHSIVLIYLGVCIRADALIAAVGFAGLFAIVWLVQNRKNLKKDEYFTGKRIVLYIVLIVLIFGAFGMDKISNAKNVSNAKLQMAEDYSLWRSNIVDYPTYKYYQDNKEKYDKIGISENDMYLISHWYFDYDGAASYKNLKKIDSIDRTNDSMQTSMVKAVKRTCREVIKSVKNLSCTGIHILLLVILFAWTLCMLRGKKWIYLVLLGISAFVMYVGIYYLNRPNYRALYVIDIGTAFWMVYYCALHSGNNDFNCKLQRSSTLAAALLIFVLIIPIGMNCHEKYQEVRGHVISEKLEKYFCENKDNLYVWATKEKKYVRNYLKPLLSSGKNCENVFGTGGWGVLSPYILEKLAKYDVTNPISGLINNEKAFYVGNKDIDRINEYMNKWHAKLGQEIKFEKVKTIDNVNIWKITR